MKNTLSQLNEIRKQLYKGGLREIAKRSGKSYQLVLDVFNGKYENLEVTKVIIEVFKEHKEKRLQLQKELNEVLETPTELGNRLQSQSEKYGTNISPLL